MLLSELIAEAQKQLAEHGDVPVDFSYTGDEPVHFVKEGLYASLKLVIPQSYEYYYGDDV